MNWKIFTNNAKSFLTNQDMFGDIRRDASIRKAQIQVFQGKDKKSPSIEWIDLVDYRYGMNNSEIQEDVLTSGITHDEWKENIKIFFDKPYVKPAHFNGRTKFI